MYLSFFTRRVHYLNKLKDKSFNYQNRRPDEIKSFTIKSNNNAVIPHGIHIHKKSKDLAMDKIFPFPLDKHAFSHWKFVLRFCHDCTSIVIPAEEFNRNNMNMCTTILYHVYRLIALCTVNGRIPIEKKQHVHCFSIVPTTATTTKIFTHKKETF